MRSEDAGKGYMSEAAAAVIEFGFNELGMHRIELEAGVGNDASIKSRGEARVQARRLGSSSGVGRKRLLRHRSFRTAKHGPAPLIVSGARVKLV